MRNRLGWAWTGEWAERLTSPRKREVGLISTCCSCWRGPEREAGSNAAAMPLSLSERSAVQLALQQPGADISISLKVRVSGWLACVWTEARAVRSGHQVHPRLYIGRCQTGALPIGKEGCWEKHPNCNWWSIGGSAMVTLRVKKIGGSQSKRSPHSIMRFSPRSLTKFSQWILEKNYLVLFAAVWDGGKDNVLMLVSTLFLMRSLLKGNLSKVEDNLTCPRNYQGLNEPGGGEYPTPEPTIIIQSRLKGNKNLRNSCEVHSSKTERLSPSCGLYDAFPHSTLPKAYLRSTSYPTIKIKLQRYTTRQNVKSHCKHQSPNQNQM